MNSDSTRPRLGTTLNDGSLALAGLAILLVGAVLWSAKGVNVERTDFAMTYVGAHIVHSGAASHLYEPGLQVQLRDSMFQHPSPLYFEHPPFEALALAPLAALPFRTAYLVWGLFNVAVLLVVIVWLRPYLPWPSEDIGYLFFWLLFAPVGVAIYQGQSSILVLAAYAAAFIESKKGKPFAAGAAFGLALLKFQFALPMALIYLLRKQWNFVAGFAASATVVACASLVGIGWGGVRDYMRLLSNVGSNPQNVSYGSAVDMPTLHGLVYALGGRRWSAGLLSTVVILLSIALLAWVARQWKSARTGTSFDLMFGAVIAASLLSGSHMFTHDFSPLVISMFLAASCRKRLTPSSAIALALTLIVFWAFPLYFLCVKWHCLYLMAIALVSLTCLCMRSAKQADPKGTAVTQAVTAG